MLVVNTPTIGCCSLALLTKPRVKLRHRPLFGISSLKTLQRCSILRSIPAVNETDLATLAPRARPDRDEWKQWCPWFILDLNPLVAVGRRLEIFESALRQPRMVAHIQKRLKVGPPGTSYNADIAQQAAPCWYSPCGTKTTSGTKTSGRPEKGTLYPKLTSRRGHAVSWGGS